MNMILYGFLVSLFILLVSLLILVCYYILHLVSLFGISSTLIKHQKTVRKRLRVINNQWFSINVRRRETLLWALCMFLFCCSSVLLVLFFLVFIVVLSKNRIKIMRFPILVNQLLTALFILLLPSFLILFIVNIGYYIELL